MLRINRQGFTLIELMVVIVIIGVLASLAIPRFTEASAKAKMAEAPGVLKSFESAYLAASAEVGEISTGKDALIFEPPINSKWFEYTVASASTGTAAEQSKGDPKFCTAKSRGDIGKFKKNKVLLTGYMGEGTFAHAAEDKEAVTAATTMIPNFQAVLSGSVNWDGCEEGKGWKIDSETGTGSCIDSE